MFKQEKAMLEVIRAVLEQMQQTEVHISLKSFEN